MHVHKLVPAYYQSPPLVLSLHYTNLWNSCAHIMLVRNSVTLQVLLTCLRTLPLLSNW